MEMFNKERRQAMAPILLGAVQALKQRPERFDMDVWFKSTYEGCGTVCCLAGQIQVNAGLAERYEYTRKSKAKSFLALRDSLNILIPATNSYTTPTIASAILGAASISEVEWIEANLFIWQDWPVQFRRMYNMAGDFEHLRRVEALEARINYFIETGE
jgi:hypothetical protein